MIDTRWLLGMSMTVVLSMAVGCGGDDDDVDGAQCGTFASCGGDLTGTWNIQGVCGASEAFEGCEDAVIETDVNYDGTLTFNTDGTYAVASTTTGSATFKLPASCLSDSGLESCDQLEAFFGEGADCTGTPATSCDCNVPVDETINESGAYTTSGPTVMLTPTDGDPTTSDYCVNGDTLTTREQGGQVYGILTR